MRRMRRPSSKRMQQQAPNNIEDASRDQPTLRRTSDPRIHRCATPTPCYMDPMRAPRKTRRRTVAAVMVAAAFAAACGGATPDSTESSEAALVGCPNNMPCVKLSSRTLNHLFVNSGTLFGEEGGAVVAIPTKGGAEQTLATTRDEVLGLTATSTHVYLLTTANGAYDVSAIPRAGGPATVLSHASAQGWRTSGAPGPMAVHDDTLYWGECGGVFSATGHVKSLALAVQGSAPKVVAGTGCPRSLAFDTTNVYWTLGGGYTGKGIKRAPLAGGNVEDIPGAGNAVSAVIEGKRLYWNTWDPSDSNTYGRSLSSGAPVEMVGGFTDEILAVRGDGIVHRAGSTVSVGTLGDWYQTVVDVEYMRDATVDGNNLYWSQRPLGSPGVEALPPGVFARRLP